MKIKKERKIERYIIENQNKLYRVSYMYVKNKDDALDIVGESILKIYKSIEKIKYIENIDSYITRVVINTAIDFIKKNSRIKLEESVEKKVIEEENDINYLIDTLEEDLKSIIILKYFEGYKIREISDILKIPESKVKNKIHKALNILRVEIKEDF